MPTAPLLVRATIPDISGIAADATTASFVFASAAIGPARGAVLSFFNDANTTNPMAGWMSPSRTRVAGMCSLQTYELDGFLHGEPHGSPIDVFPWTLGAGGGEAMPDQCAAVLAYHGVVDALPEHGPFATRPTPESAQDDGAPATHSAKTRPRAELRGRLFFGPLNKFAVDAAGDLAATFVADAQQALLRLVADSVAWSVWSRVGGLVTPIVGGWIDKELGVIRRRRDTTISKIVW